MKRPYKQGTRGWRDERGNVTVLLALAMTMMMGFVAIAIDGGLALLERSQLQKAVDAAALAGAFELPERRDGALNEARRAALLNGLTAAETNVEISADGREIKVTGTRKVSFFFAPALGIADADVRAQGKARLSPLSSGIRAVPLGVDYTGPLAFGTQVTLKVGSGGSGSFGALVLSGTGASDYENDLRSGYPVELSAGAVLSTQTGNIAGPTKRAVDARIAACPTSTYLNFSWDCPRAVTVPMYQAVVSDQNQVKQVKVVGFATFFLESVSSINTGAEVTGRFIARTASGGGNDSAPNFNTFGVRLVK